MVKYPVTMSAVEVQATREWLQLSFESFAALMGTETRRVSKWESGRNHISEQDAQRLRDIVAQTRQLIEMLVESQPTVLVAYRGRGENERLWKAHPEFSGYTARWHRAVCLAVQARLPDVRIEDGA